MSNPLLTFSDLPPFSQIRPEHIQPAVEQAITDCRQTVDQVITAGECSYQSMVMPIEEVNDRLGRIWSPIGHMNSVTSSEALRAAHDACLPLLTEYYTWLGQHQGLYQAYLNLQQSDDFARLSAPQQKVVEDALRDFKLSGIGLEGEDKARYLAIKTRLSELTSSFSNHVLDATQAWSKLVTDPAELAGLPDTALALAKQSAEAKGEQGYRLTLDFPSYFPVLTYCENRALREEMYRAFVTRASEQGPHAGQFDNGPLMDEIVALRHELALLLGFANYAELSLATKMADEPEQVNAFLNQLAERSLPQAKAELAALYAFAQQQYDATELEAWDLSFYAEKLKQHEYAVDAEQLRPYFPETKVVPGMFAVVGKLFGISIAERHDVDTWHPDVRFFDIHDAEQQYRGSFYLDLYAREGKRGGAWMDDCRGRRRCLDGSLQMPVAYLTCNFNPPVQGQPALFTHSDVETLFHEFGHGLHHMLTQVDAGGVSGIDGVPWDAVELPSQFLENWCWEADALALISGHYQTDAPLPTELLERMLAAKNFQSAMQMVRQLEFSLFDFELHQRFDPEQGARVQETLDSVRARTAVITPPPFNRFQHSFSHIFAGGYAAGYYSYKWAEVLSADAFSRFEEEGIFNAQTGKAFLNHILEQGGSQAPMALFVAFRGREPSVDALLRHSGIAQAA